MMKSLEKFVFTMCLLLGMGLLLAGCGATKQEAKPQETLKIGIDAYFYPYSYKDDKGEYKGLDIELARETAKRLHKEPVFVPVRWADKKDILDRGDIDCIWSCFSMDGREDTYSWTKPYMKSGQYVVIRTDSDILFLKDLQGKTIAVHSSTKFCELVEKGTIKAGKVLKLDTADECLDAVANGKADATGGHLAVMLSMAEARKGLEVLEQQPISYNRVGVAFKKGNTQAAAELCKVLNSMYKDGTTERIFAKYYLSKEVLMHE